jgi:hypothetical protein
MIRGKTFMEYAWKLETAELSEALDDEIDEWHASSEGSPSLYQWLGMTREEYARWAENSKTLEEIVKGRRA